MYSKGVAYLLLLFLGYFGAHKFYIGKAGIGILYLLLFWSTLHLIFCIFDLFTLGSQVDVDNALRRGGQQAQNVTVNIGGNEQPKKDVEATK